MFEQDRKHPKILYVDDQPGNLIVFKATFQKLMDVRTVTSGKEALKILSEEEFPIVISDQRMEGMSGSELLAEVCRLHPDTMRMLMTAYTDFDDVVEAINEGRVMHFISKPWDAQTLLPVLMNANTLYWTTKENKHLNEELLHKERLAAIGQVTSGLVHELANIAHLLSVASDIESQMKKGEDPSKELQILHRAVDQMLMLTETLRLYSKGAKEITLERKQIDLNSIVAAAMLLVRLLPQIRSLKDLAFEQASQPVIADVDPRRVEQVLINLVKNAAEACPEGQGIVTVRVDYAEKVATIQVIDNGPGIPAKISKRIWEGAYTTKGDRGTGLGLMVCRKIMEAHGGSIEFKNGDDEGCTFTLTFPRA